MAGSVKAPDVPPHLEPRVPPDVPPLAEFFAGVDEVRAHVDRRRQDPERRRLRLRVIAAQLLKPRDAHELCRWLVSELAEAVGASAAAVLVRQGGDTLVLWHAVGVPIGKAVAETSAATMGGIERTLQSDPTGGFELTAAPGSASAPAGSAAAPTLAQVPVPSTAFRVPLQGLDGGVGLLWLVTRTPIDPASAELLAAIADTAAVVLERALLLESIR